MAIQFICKRCNQLLGIASRKAGTQIECPKCGFEQVVPSEEAAAAALAMTKFSKSAEPVQVPSEVVVYDDQSGWMGTRQSRPGEEDGPDIPAVLESDPLLTMPDAGWRIPRGMILYKRRTLYVQGVLLLVLALVAFGAGYLVGWGNARFARKQPQGAASAEPVLMEGKVVYEPAIGQIAGDEGAVIIILPAGKLPDSTLSIRGLRPQDPAPPARDQSVRMIEKLGGLYARAGPSGTFPLVIPEQGTYHVLLISRHAARPQDTPVDELDLGAMKPYFIQVENLIRRYKYRWSLEEIRIGGRPIEHNFGLDGYEEGMDKKG